MGRIVALMNQKGGVGKTSLTVNLAGVLAEMDYNVLIVDCDPQGHATATFGINLYTLKKTMYGVLVNQKPITEIITQVRNNLDIACTNNQLADAEIDLYMMTRREDRLRNALLPIRDRFDFLFLDCPPSLGILVINVLSACDDILIPMSCEFYALIGVRQVLTSLLKMQQELNPNLNLLGIVPTRFDQRTSHSQGALLEVREKVGRHYNVFDTVIRERTDIKDAAASSQIITEYAPRSDAAQDFRQLAQEFLNAIQQVEKRSN